MLLLAGSLFQTPFSNPFREPLLVLAQALCQGCCAPAGGAQDNHGWCSWHCLQESQKTQLTLGPTVHRGLAACSGERSAPVATSKSMWSHCSCQTLLLQQSAFDILMFLLGFQCHVASLCAQAMIILYPHLLLLCIASILLRMLLACAVAVACLSAFFWCCGLQRHVGVAPKSCLLPCATDM